MPFPFEEGLGLLAAKCKMNDCAARALPLASIFFFFVELLLARSVGIPWHGVACMAAA
jgi:hypothetical protein